MGREKHGKLRESSKAEKKGKDKRDKSHKSRREKIEAKGGRGSDMSC